jgi:endonuclease/exonuclease/phosphatase (EEP) superfamily protein YafD
MTLLRWAAVAAGVLAVVVTLLPLSRSPHWLVRLWDFPRAQIAAVAALAGGAYAAFFFAGGPAEWAFLAGVGLAFLWQARRIYPYTPLAPVQVQRSERGRQGGAAPCFRVLISNVRMENRRHDRLLAVIRDVDPDLVLAVETDERWARSLDVLSATHPHVVRHPRDNWYGLMLFSRLPLLDPRVEFLVQDDVPSVHAELELPGGVRVRLHGLHPRPPEPLRDQDSTPRDAELVVVGRAIGEGPERPTVVVGDLNDVAWSPTSELFLRLSGLLDPRRGRGFFNSYPANLPFFRYPLDHVFHSRHFRLVQLRCLPNVGSDHFPMLVELSYEPDAPAEQPPDEREPGDGREAELRLREQEEEARTGDDCPGRDG